MSLWSSLCQCRRYLILKQMCLFFWKMSLNAAHTQFYTIKENFVGFLVIFVEFFSVLWVKVFRS